MENITQFGLYTAKILDTLYSSFPVPSELNQKDITSNINNLIQEDEIKYLQHELKSVIHTIKMSIKGSDFQLLSFEIGMTAPTEEELEKAKKLKSTLDIKIKDLEANLNYDITKQNNIYVGTLNFLISEALIKECSDSDRFVLTNKSFSHLNKSFSLGKIEGKSQSDIRKIKGSVANSLMSTSVSSTVSKVSGLLFEAAVNI